MFNPDDILYEDNHLLIVNKRCGDLVQPDPSGESALEDQIKAFIKGRDAKPGEVFLGVVHRIDRPVSGVVLFAKTSKALVRLNEMIREGRIHKIYWALTEATPDPEAANCATTSCATAKPTVRGPATLRRATPRRRACVTRRSGQGRTTRWSRSNCSPAVTTRSVPSSRRSGVRSAAT